MGATTVRKSINDVNERMNDITVEVYSTTSLTSFVFLRLPSSVFLLPSSPLPCSFSLRPPSSFLRPTGTEDFTLSANVVAASFGKLTRPQYRENAAREDIALSGMKEQS